MYVCVCIYMQGLHQVSWTMALRTLTPCALTWWCCNCWRLDFPKVSSVSTLLLYYNYLLSYFTR